MGDEMHSFILRIWQEASESEEPSDDWRGSIDHVGTGRRLYFRDLDGISRFVREQSGLNAQRPRSIWSGFTGWVKHVAGKLSG